MIRVETDTLRQPFERNPAINGFIHWRATMEKMRSSGHVEGLTLMHWLNHMADFRQELAPWEWIWCPDCGGRGMWVDDGNHWCPRCSGTLLGSPLTVQPEKKQAG